MSDTDQPDQEPDPQASRQVFITFNNFTSSELQLRGTDLAHGIFNPAPPQKISAARVATWKAESAGILTGTEGNVWYAPATGNDVNPEFQLYWNNPAIGSNAYSSAIKNDAQKLYNLTNAGTAGNSSSVSFSVFEVAQNWNASSWMKGISDSTSLGRLTLPGTHNSGATYSPEGDVLGMVICQDQTLAQQLNSGVRFLDIRCRVENGVFTIHHGPVYQLINFGDVLNTCSTFLSNNPSETVLMRIKQEYSEDNAEFARVFNENYYPSYEGILYTAQSTPLLGDVRGKIVIVSNASGVPGLPWNNVQDNYDPSWIEEKIQSISASLDSAISNHGNGDSALFYNFVSKQGIPLVQSIGQAAQKLNPETINLIAQKRPPVATGLGVIAMDFPNRSTGTLQILINANFRIINESFYEIRQDDVPRSGTGDYITVPFVFITDGRPPSPGSRINAVAPLHTKITGMSHGGQETFSISSDGTSASVTAGESSTPWGKDRTITLLIDADAPEDRLTGALQYFTADNAPGVRCELAVETYAFHLKMATRFTTMKPGGSDTIQYTFTTDGVNSPSSSRIRITAPPYTSIVAVSSEGSERAVISGDKKTADLMNPEASTFFDRYKSITLSADNDIPVDSRFHGSLQYLSSTGTPGTECDFEINTCCFAFSLENAECYATPGQTIDIPFSFVTYDRLASPGSKIVVELKGNLKTGITDMSRDETEALWIAEDGQRAELTATDGSRRWDESRTLTVFVENDAAEGLLAAGFLDYVSANNMNNNFLTLFSVYAVAVIPEVKSVSANGYTFAVDARFPTTAFVGAEFRIELNTGNEPDFIWTASVPWISVVDGTVRFVQRGNLDDVAITAEPRNGMGRPMIYSFTVKKWYCNNGAALMTMDDAMTWGRSNYGSSLPTVMTLTGGGVYEDAVRGEIGSPWSEWGDLTGYPDAGFVPGDYWTARPILGSNDYYRVDLTDGRVIERGSIDNPSYAVVVRDSRWPD